MNLRTALIALSLALAACATAPSSGDEALLPVAAKPTVVIDWFQDLSSMDYLGQHGFELASVHHSRSTDEIYVATSRGRVSRMQAANGKEYWATHINAGVLAEPAAARHQVFVGDTEGTLHALALSDGARLWTFEARSSIESRPAIAQGRVVFSDATETVYALDADTGKELWRFQVAAPEFFTMQGSTSPLVVDHVVYAGFANGELHALDLDTGESLWRAELGGERREFRDVDLPVQYVRGNLYAASYSGGLYALTPDGEILWRAPIESVSYFSIQDDFIAVASGIGRIEVLDRRDGRAVWRFRFEENIPSSALLFGPYLLVTTSAGPVYIFDQMTGYLFSRWGGTSGHLAPLTMGAHRLYAISNQGRLISFRLGW